MEQVQQKSPLFSFFSHPFNRSIFLLFNDLADDDYWNEYGGDYRVHSTQYPSGL